MIVLLLGVCLLIVSFAFLFTTASDKCDDDESPLVRNVAKNWFVLVPLILSGFFFLFYFVGTYYKQEEKFVPMLHLPILFSILALYVLLLIYANGSLQEDKCPLVFMQQPSTPVGFITTTVTALLLFLLILFSANVVKQA